MMSPTHPKARSYFQRGFFDELTSFRELEGRISGLATKSERGDAFEVFAEAYWAEKRALAHWVVTQRVFRKSGKLSSKRISQLDSIGFQWQVKRQRAQG